MTHKIELTAVGSGYYRVMVDGVQVSQHIAEREASERATNEKLNALGSEVYYDHDYRVDVDAVIGCDVVVPPGPTPKPEPEPTPNKERQLIGGWRIKNPFGKGAMAIDWDNRLLYMIGHTQRNELLVFDLPEMGTGENQADWPILNRRETVQGFWSGGYGNGVCLWQGKVWVSAKNIYDTNPPSTFEMFAIDGEKKLINLPRQKFSGFVKIGPGIDPLVGCGGYESGQGWCRGPSLGTMDGQVLIDNQQTTEWDKMTPREPNYSGSPWVAIGPQNGEGRWACDRVYGGGLMLPEGVVYWPWMGTGDLQYSRQNATFGDEARDRTYKYVYDRETYQLKSYERVDNKAVMGHEIDADGNVYLSLAKQWKSEQYQVDPVVAVFTDIATA